MFIQPFQGFVDADHFILTHALDSGQSEDRERQRRAVL